MKPKTYKEKYEHQKFIIHLLELLIVITYITLIIAIPYSSIPGTNVSYNSSDNLATINTLHSLNFHTRDELFGIVSKSHNIPQLIYNSTTKFYVSKQRKYTFLGFTLNNNVSVYRLENTTYINLGNRHYYSGKNQTEIIHDPIVSYYKLK